MPLPRSLFNKALYARVREIWFEGLPPTASVAPEHIVKTRWFARDEETRNAFDSVCRKDMENPLAAIAPDKNLPIDGIKKDLEEEILNCTDAKEQSETALSLLLLLDQMPRNLFRTHETLPLVYNHYDNISQYLIHKVLKLDPRPDLHPDIKYRPSVRMWFYLPLVHSESLSDHELLLRLLTEFKNDVEQGGDEEAVEALGQNNGFEKMHYDLIKKYGRYPHRNDALGRSSTEEELKYMKEGGETFGVAKKE